MAEEKQEKQQKARSLFPRLPLKDTLALAEGIHRHSDDGRIKRLTLFHELDRKPDSGTSRALVTQSSAYGLIKGSYSAEYLELTDRGRAIVAYGDGPERRRAVMEALTSSPIFAGFYEKYEGAKLRSEAVMKDYLRDDLKVPAYDVDNCLGVIVSNARDYGLVRQYSGDDRFISLSDYLTDAPPNKDRTEGDEQRPLPTVTGESKPAVPEYSSPPASTRAKHVEVCVNVQVMIPETADEKMIDNIFASMSKHLGLRE